MYALLPADVLQLLSQLALFGDASLTASLTAVVCAEGILDNPAVFASEQPSCQMSLALEFLKLQQKYPTKAGLSTVIFHCRRICKSQLNSFQLMDDIKAAASVAEVESIVQQCIDYETKGDFVWSHEKSEHAAQKAVRRKMVESSREKFEARMKRKAIRDGKDENFYLNTGPAPSPDVLLKLKATPEGERVAAWREWGLGQHCMAHHIDGCPRLDAGKECSFLHAEYGAVEPEQMG